ncbi:hypothetical protein [Halosegnis longus]|uniref:hypothetical protein n=1 Tax=Halosegnis longus TaxID=2216012 RepID=UPI00129D437C|nr:hypothetical protein [Halosegnis longus]
MSPQSRHQESHYKNWDADVDYLFDGSVDGWDETDRGHDYVRFSDGENVVHFARLKLLTGTMYVVQVPDGPNDFETIHQGSDAHIARNNALGVMME